MREKQIRTSIDMITKGFFELLEEKDYRKITMSEIAAKAMISRMTIYRHFDSKEAIFRYDMERVTKDIMATFENSNEKNLRQLLSLRNKAIYQNERLRIALENEGVDLLVNDIIMNNRILFGKLLPKIEGLETYVSQFIIGGIDRMTSEWLAHQMVEPPELMTLKMIDLIDRVMK
jgi:AcrR family transcriptional regulator